MVNTDDMRRVKSAVTGISDHIFMHKGPGTWACVVQWASGAKLEGVVYYMPPSSDSIYEVGTTGSYLTEHEVLSEAGHIVHAHGQDGTFHLPESMREYKALVTEQPASPAKPNVH